LELVLAALLAALAAASASLFSRFLLVYSMAASTMYL
jgi:hypothetical protein